jgi:hypothetical protein
MRRGGAAKSRSAESSAASRTVGDKFYPDHHDESIPARHARGGKVSEKGQLTNSSGGAGGGLGRLRKAGITTHEHD